MYGLLGVGNVRRILARIGLRTSGFIVTANGFWLKGTGAKLENRDERAGHMPRFSCQVA
jgi:hypothetical protein